MRELDASLAGMRNAWIAGRSALDAAPAQWRDAIGSDELALLALTGHATDVLTNSAPAALIERPLLPTLDAPLVPASLRQRFRRLLAKPKNAPSLERPLIAFVTARGYAAHPADWMPDAKDDWTPDLYAPWLDWVRADASTQTADANLTPENYDSWSWTERRRAIAELRARDPAAALAIIATKAASEPAERRLQLIELLQVRLSEADTEYLETLYKDRSDRVQALARAFLARLGREGDIDALAAELAEMVEFRKTGLLKRRSQLNLKTLKTGAQNVRRQELYRLVSLAALARALGASKQELVESAPEGSPVDLIGFVACVADTGALDTVRALVKSLLEKPHVSQLLLQLAPRLTDDERAALAPRLVERDVDLLETTLAFAENALGTIALASFSTSPNYPILRGSVDSVARGDEATRLTASHTLDVLLPRTGLLLDASGARALIGQITTWGLSPADPKLDMLHFNAALTPENAT